MKMVLVRKLRALAGLDEEAAVVLLAHDADFLAEVEGGAEGLDLLEQVVGEFLAGAHGHGRDVVDRLVGVQLDALAAGVAQRVDDVGLDLQQAQLEHLEQADRAGADDDGVGLDGAVVAAGGVGHFGVQGVPWRLLSGSAGPACPCGLSSRRHRAAPALRLVMLGHLRDRSALILMKASWSLGTSSSGRMALTGHSGMQTAQSMHSSGSMTRKFGPSRKQSTGQTSTQSVYLQRMHDSRTTWVMG
jgi:hypothetical protein